MRLIRFFANPQEPAADKYWVACMLFLVAFAVGFLVAVIAMNT